MSNYIPISKAQQEEMLKQIGLEQAEQLFACVNEEIRCKELNIPHGKSEFEIDAMFQKIAKKNKVFSSIFRGAGAYRHYIPSIVKQVTSKETFVTAYTPYQAEISQGLLQAIFEYQTEICELTGMHVANASVYDGAAAAAEATVMCRERARQRVLIAGNSHPDVIDTIKTYCFSAGAPAEIVDLNNGIIDQRALKNSLGDDVACLYVQSPNFFGLVEDIKTLADICHDKDVKLIVGTNPISLALYKTPAALSADIVVGEGQPLGMPLSFGGPYLGFMATTSALMRKLPGRIVGETTDRNGKRCFVLTLQAREQHIRREKASSSICSNQALCAFTATVYLAAMGPIGIRKVAELCYSKAHYLAQELLCIGFERPYAGEFFHEFVTGSPISNDALLKKLEENDILGGLPLSDGNILWCCTEMNTKEDIDKLVQICKEVTA